ncbi:ketosteroid isomerase-like protein [Allocatelliglobosispora scoriae]|uniref:Ketosteroid isomerase-like protein n=1 Tax=Allocatelliglobosispora scoriae TaxID=643052 RepID=A0A841C0Q6_9ACTN|nr:nuclear transport factor 2 family protein [Allocatelliglobosispora scoriae]MBB5872733.1 ketosteroid isomerase-like protein [Allocatelliglobosispora scoriae]
MSPHRTASAAVSAIGHDHAQLSYAYLNSGDIDGYASLFHADAVVRRPDAGIIRGRDELERDRTAASRTRDGHYVVQHVFASGGRVAVTGRFVLDAPRATGDGVEFADIFTVDESGLLLAQSTYFFVPPTGPPTAASAR